MIHYNGAHANEYIVVDGTAVNDGAVADRYIVADGGWRTLISAVNDGGVLNIDFVADANLIPSGIRRSTDMANYRTVARFLVAISDRR